jgi:hypothetical protein
MNDVENWLSEFFESNPGASPEADEKATKAYKNDLFKDVIPALDRRDIKYYSTLNEEQQKDISIWILTRWMSSIAKNQADQLYAVNVVVNSKSKYLAKHKELQWMLLAITGTGKPERHVWIAPPKGIKKNKVEEAVLARYPMLRDDELELMLKINDQDSLEDFFRECGYDDIAIKEIFKGSQKGK